jgi:GNAT superfamily N-acetyltransferase
MASCANVVAAGGLLARQQRVAGGVAVFAGTGLPLNRAVGMGMAAPVVAADLDALERFYASLGAVSQIDHCPYADPSLVALLRARGYLPAMFLAVFSVELPAPADEAPPTPDEVQVEPVDAAGREGWARVVARGYLGHDDVHDDAIDLVLARIASHRPEVRCSLARVAGEVAGAGALAVHDDVAVFFSASTLPAHRGRGVQTALLRARLADAAAHGCELGAVLVVPGGDSERNIERFGFRPAYTRAVLVRRG